MLDPEFKIGGWRPFLELHSIEKLLKRLLYGRRYSKPSDLLFQDYHWQAWAKAHESKPPTGRTKPSISPPPSLKAFGVPPEIGGFYLNNANDKEREGAFAFYLAETMAHKAKPKLLINTDTNGGENWVEHPNFMHDEGWDNPAPSKEVIR
jgi:hypothetical protein